MWAADWETDRLDEVKHKSLGSFANRSFSSHSAGGRKSELVVLAGLISSEASLLGLETALLAVSPHVLPMCMSVSLLLFQ